MGVHRLWSFIKKNQNRVVSYVDLVEVAEEYPGGLKILVDFYSWEHFMANHFWNSVTETTDNRNIVFAGGEYSLLDTFIKEFIERLRAVNIELVFFLDGAKGTGQIASKQKMRTWQFRYFEKQDRMRKIADFLRGRLPYDQLDLDRLTRPCLQEVQNVLTLQDCGCTIHVQVSGEADHIIAKHLRDDNAAFAVLSNDTDFCIFKNCVLIPLDYFDVYNDLGLGSRSLSVKEPERLKCGVVHTESIMNLLRLQDHESLIEFAVISGNDFTLPFLNDLHVFRTSYIGKMNRLAVLIYQNRVAERCAFFGPAIARDPDLQEAVEHSRRFYSLNLDDEEVKERSFAYTFLADDIKRGQVPSTALAMYRGLYWHRQVLEDPSPNVPCAEIALKALRAYIYAILLPSHRMSVKEIGRMPYLAVAEMTVRKSDDTSVPDLVQVKNNSFDQNLQVFEHILQHQELQPFNEGESYFKIYGLRWGFLCYLLRYFLLMNWGKNLFISEQEFLALVAWTFASHGLKYHPLKIVPSPRCVTVENWFLSLYRNAYAFLGNILSLSHEFPTPRELFSGGSWVAIYTSCVVFDPNPTFREPHPYSVSMEDLTNINVNIYHIIMSNKNVVKDIVRDLFQFD